MDIHLEKFPQEILEHIYYYAGPHLTKFSQLNKFFNNSTKAYLTRKISTNIALSTGYTPRLPKTYHHNLFLRISKILMRKDRDLYKFASHKLEELLLVCAKNLKELVQQIAIESRENKKIIEGLLKLCFANHPEEILFLLSKFELGRATNTPKFIDQYITYYSGDPDILLKAKHDISLAIFLDKYKNRDSFSKLSEVALNNKIIIYLQYLVLEYLTLYGNTKATEKLPEYHHELLSMKELFGVYENPFYVPTIRDFIELCCIKLNYTKTQKEEILVKFSHRENRIHFLEKLVTIAKSGNYFLLYELFKRNLLFIKLPPEVLWIFSHPLSLWLFDAFDLNFINANCQGLRFFISPKWQKYQQEISDNIEIFTKIFDVGSFTLQSSSDMYDFIAANFLNFEKLINFKTSTPYYLNMFKEDRLNNFLLIPNVHDKLANFIADYEKKFNVLPVIPTLKKMVTLDKSGHEKVMALLKKLAKIKLKPSIKICLSKHFYLILDLILEEKNAPKLARLYNYLSDKLCKPLHLEMMIQNRHQEWPYLLTNQELSDSHIKALEKIACKNSEGQKSLIEVFKSQHTSEQPFIITSKIVDVVDSNLHEATEDGYEQRQQYLQTQYDLLSAETQQMEEELNSLKEEYQRLKRERADPEEGKHKQKRKRFR